MHYGKTTIKIFDLDEITELISRKKTDYSIVSIRSTDFPTYVYAPFKKYRHNYADIIVEVFDDVEGPTENLISPDVEHIRRILKWARKRANIAVHCTAGISRSSAVAYLIACARMPAADAIKLLKHGYHEPNTLVLYHGLMLLKDHSILNEYLKWRRESDAMLYLLEALRERPNQRHA